MAPAVPTPTWLPPLAARRAFLSVIAAEVRMQMVEAFPDLTAAQRTKAAAIVASQAGLETADGRSTAWKLGWNFGNVCAGSSWTGPVVMAGDTEPDASGKYVPITQRFRKYATLRDAVADFLRVLAWPRYRAAREALLAGDEDRYALRLRDDDPRTAQLEGGYYTARLSDYQAGIRTRLQLAQELLA